MATIKLNKHPNLNDAFNDFLLYKASQGLAEKTLRTYKSHFGGIFKYLNPSTKLSDLKRRDIQNMIAQMRERNLSVNTIATYVRILRVFLSWARAEGLCDITIPNYRTEETVKDTYTDSELYALLKKPNLKSCRFPEYRSWVIINFLVNSGARSSTIRNILISDVDLDNGLVTYRHNKNHKVQVIPLCSQMIVILKEYLHYRKGVDSDYLFCTESGEMLTENALRSSIFRYNTDRGVEKNSIHLFRHTFAKKFLIDCGGNAFTLQKILGHSTLDMTRHYCNIFNVDLVKNYDSFSPLQQLTSKEKRITLKQPIMRSCLGDKLHSGSTSNLFKRRFIFNALHKMRSDHGRLNCSDPQNTAYLFSMGRYEGSKPFANSSFVRFFASRLYFPLTLVNTISNLLSLS